MITGSCLCQKVRYSIKGKLGPISHCHCLTCQKAHASAFATVARVKSSDFILESGEENLSAYASTPQKKRFFCSDCGAQIYAHTQGQDEFVIRLGTLDSDPGAKPIRHIFVEEKASWYDLDAKLERFDQWPK